jgi:hypothetical protein
VTSPFRNPGAHDQFTLYDGAKQVPFPGVARVTAGLTANSDTQAIPGGGTVTAQLNDASGEVQVQLTFWTDEQWVTYQSRLKVLRTGSKAGPANFICAHPEVRARRIQKIYFDNERMEAYNPRDGYRVTLTFKEKLKVPVAPPASGDDGLSGTPVITVTVIPTTSGASVKTTPAGAKVLAAAITNEFSTPRPSRDRSGTTASGGYCSTFARYVGVDAGLSDSLFGGSANETENRFRAAKMTIPWSAAAQQQLQAGDFVFYGNDPSGFGHVGIYDGKGGVISNSLVTYQARHGKLDAAGRPTGYDAQGRPVDARDTVPLSQLGTPTSIGKPTKVTGPLIQGPAAPLGRPVTEPVPKLTFAPSNTPPKIPPGVKIKLPPPLTAASFSGVGKVGP